MFEFYYDDPDDLDEEDNEKRHMVRSMTTKAMIERIYEHIVSEETNNQKKMTDLTRKVKKLKAEVEVLKTVNIEGSEIQCCLSTTK
jgi:hypothetical protein